MLHTISRKKSIWLILIAMTLLVVACTPDDGGSGNIPVDRPEETEEPTAEPTEPSTAEPTTEPTAEPTSETENLDFLLNTNWDLVTMNGDDSVQGSTPTLSFDGQSLNGTTGCNSYFGPFTLNGTELSIEFLGQTEIACELDLDVQEQTYLRMLMSAVSITLENETLTIHTEEGDLIYQPASHQALEGTAWNLTGIASGDALVSTGIDELISAEFVDGRMTGNAGCNNYGSTYETSGSNITLGEIETTLMACEDEELMARESEFLAALPNIATYKILRNSLTLFDAEGNVVMTFIAYV